jgi:hypothetical protein
LSSCLRREVVSVALCFIPLFPSSALLQPFFYPNIEHTVKGKPVLLGSSHSLRQKTTSIYLYQHLI